MTQRTFYFILVVTHHVESMGSYPADTVQNKDTLVTSVEDHIVSVAVGVVRLLDQCLIPSGNEEGIHAVTLRFDANNISLPEKLLQVDFV